MIGDDGIALSPADDNLHPPASEHPWWTESFWFAFGIPQHQLMVCVYPWFRPNLGLQCGGVLVWDTSGELPWELRFCEYDYHLAMPEDLDMRHGVLANGLRIEVEEPLRSYAIAFNRPELQLDVRFDAIMEPLVSGRDGRPAHLDQAGRVHGRLTLDGEHLAVESYGMRDRSWAVRLDATRVGYAWGTADGTTSFLVIALMDGDDGQVVDGYLLRDGMPAKLTGGHRRTHRRNRRPSTIELEVTDALGRAAAITGECVSRTAFSAYPGTFSWDSMVRWTGDAGAAWGEDQDVWTMADWHRFSGALPS
jgi:hypothetical protein